MLCTVFQHSSPAPCGYDHPLLEFRFLRSFWNRIISICLYAQPAGVILWIFKPESAGASAPKFDRVGQQHISTKTLKNPLTREGRIRQVVRAVGGDTRCRREPTLLPSRRATGERLAHFRIGSIFAGEYPGGRMQKCMRGSCRKGAARCETVSSER